MRRIAFALLATAACHDWSSLSDHYDELSSCASRGPSACPAGASITCNGFDTSNALSTWFAPQQTNATSGIDATCLFRGASSLHVVGAGAKSNDYVRGDWGFTTTIPNDLFVRAYFYLSDVPVQPLRLLNIPAGTNVILVHIAGGDVGVLNDFATSSSSTIAFSAKRWTCLELEVLQGTPGAVRVWVDGVNAIDAAQNVNPGTPFDRVLVGPLVNATSTSDVAPFDVWIDEAAISSTRIGCL